MGEGGISATSGGGTTWTTQPSGEACNSFEAISFSDATVPRTCKAGTHRISVYATDAAGNEQANVASDRLIVK